MKKLFSVLISLLPLTVLAGGVKFDDVRTWEEIREAAKAQNKPVFMFFTTAYCGWCWEMKKTTFPKAAVGEFINENFIPVAVTVDREREDSPYIREWYEDARKLKDEYNVKAFPHFLVF